jgi:predicted Holliday junction resolvase-like endonuclease
MFRLPSYTLGSEQTIQDQIKELREDEVERVKRSIRDQVKDQMESIFPNGGIGESY